MKSMSLIIMAAFAAPLFVRDDRSPGMKASGDAVKQDVVVEQVDKGAGDLADVKLNAQNTGDYQRVD